MRFEQVQLEHEQINKATFITITCISMPIQCITNGRRFLPWASGGDIFHKHLFIDWIELYIYPLGIYNIFFISIVRIYLYGSVRIVNIVTSSRIEQNQTESFINSANNFKTKPNRTNHIKMCYVFFSSCNLILGSDEMVIFKCLITYVRYPNEVIQCKPNQVRILFLLVSDNGYWNNFCVYNNNLYKSKWRKKEVRHEAIATKLELEQPRHISVLSNLPA